MKPAERITRHIRALSDPSSADPTRTLVLVQDKREQNGFDSRPAIPMVRGTLTSGDYSIVGYETEVAVERKSLDDLVGSITWGNDRFQRELERLRAYRLAAVVIEASPVDVEMHRYFAKKVEPDQVFATVASLHVKHSIPFLFAGNRKHAAGTIFRLLHSYWLARRAEAQAEETAKLEAAILTRGTP